MRLFEELGLKQAQPEAAIGRAVLQSLNGSLRNQSSLETSI